MITPSLAGSPTIEAKRPVSGIKTAMVSPSFNLIKDFSFTATGAPVSTWESLLSAVCVTSTVFLASNSLIGWVGYLAPKSSSTFCFKSVCYKPY